MRRQPEVKISVALVTRNRPDLLRNCLSSLRNQSVQPYEVIVSDDSDPQNAPAVQNVAHSFNCRYVCGPRRGLYANRNNAALAAEGTHIRTMDDDHTFPADHFRMCQTAVESDPSSIWTTGEICYLDGRQEKFKPVCNQLHPAGVGGPITNPDDNWGIADGSTIYPARVWREGNRMVEWYFYGASYLEFGAYLYRKGFRSRCLPGALVEHHYSPVTKQRGRDITVIGSRLFASLCFNLRFRPDPYLAAKYALSCVLDAGFNPEFMQTAPATFERVQERWDGL